MTRNSGSRIAGKLCTLASQKYGESPAGTASDFDRLLLIELPKPWPAEVIESPFFPSGVSEVINRAFDDQEVKLLCMEPDKEYSVKGHSRVLFFSRPVGPFAVYGKDEFVIPIDEVGTLVKAVVEQPETIQQFDHYRQDTADIRDILICTHGVYDTCCGSFGYPIYHILRNKYTTTLRARMRVWRVSHIGGHRFAPNLVDMPEGRNWVRVESNSLRTIVLKDEPPSRIAAFHRGWAGVTGPFEQLVEQEALMQQGWVWSRLMKSSSVVSSNNVSTHVRLNYTDPVSNTSGAYEATVERTKTVAKANCLNTVDEKIDQYSVTQLVEVI